MFCYRLQWAFAYSTERDEEVSLGHEGRGEGEGLLSGIPSFGFHSPWWFCRVRLSFVACLNLCLMPCCKMRGSDGL
jgi:hypothetical protein